MKDPFITEHLMLDLLSAAIGYGGYISIIKLLTFSALFFAWLPLLSWVHQDAKALGTKGGFWTGIVLAAGAAAALIWLVMPIFIA
ncbi:MAG: hypothetical protein ACYS4T_17670, partial [Planctomycetota bacterium]